MIKKLRIKFVVLSSLSVALMLITMVFTINIINFTSLEQSIKHTINTIADNDGVMPKYFQNQNSFPSNSNREASYDTRFFVVYLTDNNQVFHTDTSYTHATSSSDATKYALEVIETKELTGYIDDYKYLKTEIRGNTAIIFLDVARDIEITKSFLYNSLAICFISMTLMLIISYLLSPLAVSPVALAYQKQKEFITNASHEIKTPLTIISANLEIIEMSTGENKWIDSSNNQVQRLSTLVTNLIDLSRIGEFNEIDKYPVSLSDLSEMAVASYQSIAIAQNKNFTASIAPDITCFSNDKDMSQLIYILLDNAFKHSNDYATIQLSLAKKQDKIVLTIYNTVDNIQKGSHKKLFDRFYRSEDSRNSEGFGLGLALAKSIVKMHKWNISAKSTDGKSILIEVSI